MSFLDIKDPEERDGMIADYLAVKKTLNDRNLQARGKLMNRRRDLEENPSRLLQATRRCRGMSLMNWFQSRDNPEN